MMNSSSHRQNNGKLRNCPGAKMFANALNGVVRNRNAIDLAQNFNESTLEIKETSNVQTEDSPKLRVNECKENSCPSLVCQTLQLDEPTPSEFILPPTEYHQNLLSSRPEMFYSHSTDSNIRDFRKEEILSTNHQISPSFSRKVFSSTPLTNRLPLQTFNYNDAKYDIQLQVNNCHTSPINDFHIPSEDVRNNFDKPFNNQYESYGSLPSIKPGIEKLSPSKRRTLLLSEVFGDQEIPKQDNVNYLYNNSIVPISNLHHSSFNYSISEQVVYNSSTGSSPESADHNDCFYESTGSNTQWNAFEISHSDSNSDDFDKENNLTSQSYCTLLDSCEEDFRPNFIISPNANEPSVFQVFIKPNDDEDKVLNDFNKSVESECTIQKPHNVEFQRKSQLQDNKYSVQSSRENRNHNTLPSYPVERLLVFKSPGFIDSHCHLDLILRRNKFMGSFADFRRRHASEFPPSYQGCVAIFCYPHTFQYEYLWKKHLTEENVWASFGVHPKRADSYNDSVEKALFNALEHPQVRALGEIGLDYSKGNFCSVDVQQRVFRRQLEIAVGKNLPLVIHCRDAYEDCLHMLKLIVPKDHKIHLHCFKSSWKWAEKYLIQFPNLCIGITNVVTFPDAKIVHDVATKIPLNRLLLETDAPYFVPYQINKSYTLSHPGMAIHVAAQVASLKDVPLREVLYNTLQNTRRVYNL